MSEYASKIDELWQWANRIFDMLPITNEDKEIISDHLTNLQVMDDEIDGLKMEIVNREQDIAHLESRLDDAEATIRELEVELDEQGETVDDLLGRLKYHPGTAVSLITEQPLSPGALRDAAEHLVIEAKRIEEERDDRMERAVKKMKDMIASAFVNGIPSFSYEPYTEPRYEVTFEPTTASSIFTEDEQETLDKAYNDLLGS